ncbi:copper resistance protein CopC [Microbispora sp. NBC_01189]|uniref:copper resistance CopC family protein n=1 Tax=Microbispora sp. NBC_01189 TaxID=2903583 RepID=UPI002E1202B4|nr:copper resistance protein CopC [Microbispora sp. NBC_01189]
MKRPSLRVVFLFGISCLFAVVLAAPASAHDSLKKSTPAANSVVSGLDEIELEFSAHVSFPVVVLHDATGRRFESGTPRVSDSMVTEAVAGPLPPGGYTIAWRVVSSDGHPIQGEIPFVVGSSSAASAGGAAPAATPVAGADRPDRETGTPGWIWAVAAAVAVLGAAAVLVARGRKPATLPDNSEDRPSGHENGEGE